jgi:hypothetical protein
VMQERHNLRQQTRLSQEEKSDGCLKRKPA